MSPLQRSSFKLYGRSYQLLVDDADDLERVAELDEALWVATGIPVNMFNVDKVLIALIDQKSSRRILTKEIREAIDWTLRTLPVRDGITEARRVLQLSDVAEETPDGARICRSMRKMIASLPQGGPNELELDQVRAIKAKVEAQPVSEAGVVLPEASDDDEVASFIRAIINALGGVPHPGGSKGVHEKMLEDFLSQARALVSWYEEAYPRESALSKEIMPFGEETPRAHARLETVRKKLDQHFTLCRAVALDERVAEWARVDDTRLEAFDPSDAESLEALIESAPLALPLEDQVLNFDAVRHPDYVERLDAFRQEVVQPLLGGETRTLNRSEWSRIQGTFAPYEAWQARRPDVAVSSIGWEQLRGHLNPELETAVRRHIAKSQETAFVLDDIRLVEKAILFQAYIIEIVNNFVSFPHLYDPGRRALFEEGTLIMDGRRFNLAIRVDDLKSHLKMALTSKIFVMYVELRPGKKDAYKVAIPVTAGGRGNLAIGKHGVFERIDGSEHDAILIELIENPVSLLEAIVAPFKRMGALVTGKLESFTMEADKKLKAETTKLVTDVKDGMTSSSSSPLLVPRSKMAAPADPSGSNAARAAGMVAGWGVAVAALGSSLAYVTKTLAALSLWTVLGGIAGTILAIILPASLVTAIRLRKRDLSAVLEGSGMAINARMRLTWSQSRFFTETPAYPFGHPLLRKAVAWIAIIALITVLSWAARRALQELQTPPDPPVPTTLE